MLVVQVKVKLLTLWQKSPISLERVFLSSFKYPYHFLVLKTKKGNLLISVILYKHIKLGPKKDIQDQFLRLQLRNIQNQINSVMKVNRGGA